MIQLLLEANANMEAVTWEGSTPLLGAAEFGHAECVTVYREGLVVVLC